MRARRIRPQPGQDREPRQLTPIRQTPAPPKEPAHSQAATFSGGSKLIPTLVASGRGHGGAGAGEAEVPFGVQSWRRRRWLCSRSRISRSLTFMPFGYWLGSSSAATVRPVRVRVRVLPIRLTMTSWLVSGRAAPVHRDVPEQPVLDFVPLGGAGNPRGSARSGLSSMDRKRPEYTWGTSGPGAQRSRAQRPPRPRCLIPCHPVSPVALPGRAEGCSYYTFYYSSGYAKGPLLARKGP